MRGTASRDAAHLDAALGTHDILIGDLKLAEILRGVPDETAAALVNASLDRFNVVELAGKAIAVKAAENYRVLRGKGVTVRGTIDLVIGTWCIAHSVPLLHSDRDFAGMEKWLGLMRWRG